jgi:acyl-CoA thioester hydrolase
MTIDAIRPTLQHEFEYDVQIFDTDCYGVVWHGSYTKWLEYCRVKLLDNLGLSLKWLSDEHDVIFPVVEQTFRFKRSAKFGQKLLFKTRLDPQQPKLIFYQDVYRNDDSTEQVLETVATILPISSSGKVHRKWPGVLAKQLV